MALDYQRLFESASGLCLILDRDFRILAATDAYLEATMTRRDIIGHVLSEVFPDDPDNTGSRNLRASLESVLRTGEAITMPPRKHDIRRPDGGVEERYWSSVSSPLFSDGELTNIMHRVEDVTELVRLQRLEDEQAKTNRAKDEFIAVVSHELRTPMTSILGWARMLELGGLDDRTHQEAIDAITRGTRAQAKLIEDLLDESRIASGKVRLELRPLDLDGLMEAAVKMIHPGAEARRMSISIEASGERLRIAADPIRMQQVIDNVLSNAIKFTPEGGRVVIRLRREERNAVVEISDTGRGMSEDLLPYVFERFRQGDGLVSDRQRGLGLGLAIARHLVEMHEGTITAASEGEGRGSTFTVRLPLHEAPAAEFFGRGDGRDRALPRLENVRVMIVEDEIDNRTVLARVMEQCGAEVQCAGTASAALGLVAAFRPDVLIADIALPDLDGCHLMERIRAGTPDDGSRTPALALTVLSRPGEQARIRAAGFDVFRQKPIDPVDLAYEVARLAGSRGMTPD